MFKKLKKLWKKDTTFVISLGGPERHINVSWFRCYLGSFLFLFFCIAVYFASTSYSMTNQWVVSRLTDPNESYRKKIGIYKDKFNGVIEKQDRFCYVIECIPKGLPCGTRIISGFGWRRHPIFGGTHFHKGIDLQAVMGTPIMTTGSGKIKFAGTTTGYGHTVFIDHGYGIETRYGHCLSLNCRIGDEVKEGQVIAFVGSSGWSVAPHLHYEVREGRRPVDPKQYVLEEE